MWSTERAGWWAQDGRGSHESQETLAARPGAAAGKGVRTAPGPGSGQRPLRSRQTTRTSSEPGQHPQAPGRPGRMLLCRPPLAGGATRRWCHSEVVPQDKAEVAASTSRGGRNRTLRLPLSRPVHAERTPQRLSRGAPHLADVPRPPGFPG